MDSQTFPRESSVLDARTWISICRAFTTLDADLQPELFDIASSNYPVTHVYFWRKDCGDQYGSLEHDNLSLQEASMRIAGMPVESNKSIKLLDDYIKLLLTDSDQSDYVLFQASPVTQLLNHFLLRFGRRAWKRYTNPARNLSLDDCLPANSLLEALVAVSLRELTKLEENENQHFDEPNALVESELLVRAACTFLRDLAAVIPIDSNALASLYGNLVHITQTQYERRSLNGSIVVTTETAELDITFNSHIPVEDHRATRKLFEMAANGVAIVTDGINVLGLREFKDTPAKNSNELEIRVSGYGYWSIIHDRSTIFEVINGIPRLPRPKLSRLDFENALKQFSNSDTNTEMLWSVVNAATHAEHGTIVVIANNAINEAQRLSSEATLIIPTILPDSVMPAVFAIDGALLLGLDGQCHAVGVILDGEVSIRGTQARGSRYNSAVRYVDSQNGAAIAIVVSEDNYIDLINYQYTAKRKGEIIKKSPNQND